MSEPVNRRMWIAIVVFQIMQIVAICMMAIKVYSSPDSGKPVYALFGQTVPSERIKDAVANPDALKIAYDVGVLELLSLSLTIITVLLALFAVVGFWMIRGAALKSASDAAKEEMKAIGEKYVTDWIEKHGRSFFETAASVQSGSTVPSISIGDEKAAQITKNADEIKED